VWNGLHDMIAAFAQGHSCCHSMQAAVLALCGTGMSEIWELHRLRELVSRLMSR